MTKETPILFSTPMVQAILEGRKTMTRRTVKSEHVLYHLDVNKFVPSYYHNNDEGWCPFGKPDDILWVRETFTVLDYWEETQSVQVMFEDASTLTACLTDHEWAKFSEWKHQRGKKSSLFLFKSLSRIWLEVTDVRVERAHDISEADALTEGIKEYPNHTFGLDSPGACMGVSASLAFMRLWHTINGEESWNQNPWVWVVSFKVLSTTGKPNSTPNPETSVATDDQSKN